MANLVLKSGEVFEGEIVGNTRDIVGEVVFNTAMVGYEDVLTDPSYKGQIVVFTYPSIGNYGFKMLEGKEIYPAAIVIQNSWVNEDLFSELVDSQVAVLRGVDTRKLTEIIRDNGSTMGKIIEGDDCTKALESLEKVTLISPVKEVSCKARYLITPKLKKVAVLDFGIKDGILDHLVKRNCLVEVFPAFSTAQEVLASNPDGVLLSNGPGDPRELEIVMGTIKELVGKVPIMGICLGHQLLSLALGCDVEKMKYGHRGGNHGVKDLKLNKTFITSQNHGYVVKEESVRRNINLEITHVNVNDNTIEGIRHKKHPIFSVQFHPEGSPGTQETDYLFDKFMGLMRRQEIC